MRYGFSPGMSLIFGVALWLCNNDAEKAPFLAPRSFLLASGLRGKAAPFYLTLFYFSAPLPELLLHPFVSVCSQGLSHIHQAATGFTFCLMTMWRNQPLCGCSRACSGVYYLSQRALHFSVCGVVNAEKSPFNSAAVFFERVQFVWSVVENWVDSKKDAGAAVVYFLCVCCCLCFFKGVGYTP